MKFLLSIAFVATLAGCASAPVPYDEQFSTLDTVDANGMRRSHAWLIGPTPQQKAAFEARAKK